MPEFKKELKNSHKFHTSKNGADRFIKTVFEIWVIGVTLCVI